MKTLKVILITQLIFSFLAILLSFIAAKSTAITYARMSAYERLLKENPSPNNDLKVLDMTHLEFAAFAKEISRRHCEGRTTNLIVFIVTAIFAFIGLIAISKIKLLTNSAQPAK
jgi:hypothetical protein